MPKYRVRPEIAKDIGLEGEVFELDGIVEAYRLKNKKWPGILIWASQVEQVDEGESDSS